MSSTPSSTFPVENFINGVFVPTKDYLDNFCPSTGEVYGRVPNASAEDVEAAVSAAKAAAPGWASTSISDRSNLLLKVADLLEKRLDEFAEAESMDQGKPVSLAKNMDMKRCVANFRFFATAILHHEEMSSSMDTGAINYTIRSPVGVCGLISPWNLPLYLLTWKLAPAIAVGNTVVCKPSEFTSVTAWLLCSLLNEAGLPPGVVNMVFGLGGTAGAALVRHPDVPLISFTGGTVTGARIAIDAAPFCKKLSLELGGKNPNIIFADADLDLAIATSVRSSFLNQGEICLCGSRIFIEDSIYDEFVPRFVEACSKLVVGDPKDSATNVGALVSQQHLDKVMYYISEVAVQEGAQVLLGGKRASVSGRCANGYFVEPTILAGLPYTSRCASEEIFGPVVTLHRFSSTADAIAYANSSKYGLSATVWTRDLSRAHKVAAAIQTGTVWINCWLQRDLRVPFGGVKESGVGREGGAHSIDFYTEVKTVCIALN